MVSLNASENSVMALELTTSLRTLVASKFKEAVSNQNIIFSATQVAVLPSRYGSFFQLRYLANLANKPQGIANKSDDAKKPKAKVDPFDNPAEELLVARIPSSAVTHNLVLNKFPVIANHFILATKYSKPQSFVLEEDDISLAYECIKQWNISEASSTVTAASGNDDNNSTKKKKVKRSLFVFFNSGAESGASQPHRHLQLLPVEDMRDKDSEWSLLVDTMDKPCRPSLDLLCNPTLPFLHYAVSLNTDMSPQVLHETYLYLVRAAIFSKTKSTIPFSRDDFQNYGVTNAEDSFEAASERETTDTNQAVSIDYNLCMTSTKMVILPRERGEVYLPDAPREDGPISINGTILAGTLLTKSENHWNRLQNEPAYLNDILEQIGVPKPLFEHKV